MSVLRRYCCAPPSAPLRECLKFPAHLDMVEQERLRGKSAPRRRGRGTLQLSRDAPQSLCNHVSLFQTTLKHFTGA